MTIKKLESDEVDIKILIANIEQTFQSFGVIVRVVEFYIEEKYFDFYIEVAVGTTIESITNLHKEIGFSLASPSGDVEIIAPVLGRSVISIKIPRPILKEKNRFNKNEKYKIIRIETERIIYKGILPQLKSFLLSFLKLIERLINSLISLLKK